MKDTNKNHRSPNLNQEKYYCSYCKMSGCALEMCFKANPNKVVCSNCNMPRHSAEACHKLQGYLKGSKACKVKHFNVNHVSVIEQLEPNKVDKQLIFS